MTTKEEMKEVYKKWFKEDYDLILKSRGYERAKIALMRWADQNCWGYSLEDMERILYGDAFVDTQLTLREANRKLKP